MRSARPQNLQAAKEDVDKLVPDEGEPAVDEEKKEQKQFTTADLRTVQSRSQAIDPTKPSGLDISAVMEGIEAKVKRFNQIKAAECSTLLGRYKAANYPISQWQWIKATNYTTA